MPFHYTREDFLNALRSLGITKGDRLLCSTSLGLLGIPQGAGSQEDINALCLDVLTHLVGSEGTLLAPAYSYTFCRSTAEFPATYDPKTTPSEIGPFPEFFRKCPGVVRSMDPLFSYAGMGPEVPELFKDLPHTSYGEDCLFSRLRGKNIKICNIGIGTGWALFIHHVDWLCGSPFRYDKIFWGNIVINDEETATSWIYYVPIRHPAGRVSSYKIGDRAAKEGLFSFADLGRGRVYVADYDEYFEYMMRQKRADMWVTAQGPPGDPVRLEEERIGKSPDPVPENLDSDEVFSFLQTLSRDCVSDGFCQSLQVISRFLPSLEICEYTTGKHVFSWIVPEKWTCYEGGLFKTDGTPLFFSSEGSRWVAPYSLSYEGIVSRETLTRHIQFSDSPSLCKAGLYRRDWALFCSLKDFERLSESEYLVRIKTDFSCGNLKIGEYLLSGESEEFFLICVSLEGRGAQGIPSLFAALQTIGFLEKMPRRHFSYRLLLLPGEVGAVAWLSDHENMMDLCRGCVFIDDAKNSSSTGFRGVSLEDPPLIRAFSCLRFSSVLEKSAHNLRHGGFSPTGNMFRRCAVPILYLFADDEGMQSLNRHTALQNVSVLYELFRMLECNFIPLPHYRGELCRERYPELDYASGTLLYRLPSLIDGKDDVLLLSEKIEVDYFAVLDFLMTMEKCGLIARG